MQIKTYKTIFLAKKINLLHNLTKNKFVNRETKSVKKKQTNLLRPKPIPFFY